MDEGNVFQPPDIDKARTNELDYINDLIYASNYVRGLGLNILRLETEKNICEEEKGVLIGFMVYSYKLYDSLIYVLCQNRLEISYLLLRTSIDIAIQLRYLINNINTDLHLKVIKSSLAYDKKRLQEINKKIINRIPSKLEQRMLNDIQKTFNEANVKIEDVKFSTDKDWLPMKMPNLANHVGLKDLYEFTYRISSSAVHGSWRFHKQYNLTKQNQKYLPQILFSRARPEAFEVGSIIFLNAALDYLRLFPNDNPGINFVLSEINKLIDWYHKMGEKHEDTIP